MSRVDQENRDRALEIIKQWIKEEEERTKKIEVTKSPKKMNNVNPRANKLEISKDVVRVTEAAKVKEKVIDYILKNLSNNRLIAVGLFLIQLDTIGYKNKCSYNEDLVNSSRENQRFSYCKKL